MSSDAVEHNRAQGGIQAQQHSPPQSHSQDESNSSNRSSASSPKTACFNCRAGRQKCDRRKPCSRCVSQHRACRYPSGTNRGRKQGSTNKPDTVEKLLNRINESSVRDQVIEALVSASQSRANTAIPSQTTSPRLLDTPISVHSKENGSIASIRHTSDANESQNRGTECEFNNNHAQSSVVSSIHLLASTINTNAGVCRTRPHQVFGSQQTTPFQNHRMCKGIIESLDERLTRYFAPQLSFQTDWQVLARQSIDSTFKLEPEACDPITARLCDRTDATFYFQLFYDIRNPLLGSLDPILHTPEFVYTESFTLFSAICALGCAVSPRPRDRILYPALMTLAENNMKWSIAAAVKSLETIQAIIIMKYWAPVCNRHSDDPYWLHLSHAGQLARELGINKPSTITERINTLSVDTTADLKERLFRNYERTWLYIFIADKTFGIITGRTLAIAWNEIPSTAFEWWKKPMTAPLDRVISGIIEARGILLNALEGRKSVNNTVRSISEWHSQACEVLERTRGIRTTPDGPSSESSLALLGFYMDHSILILNGQALRDIMSIDETNASPELSEVTKKTVKIASRVLDTVLKDQSLNKVKLGLHNNQIIIICHSVTEILHAIKRGGLTPEGVLEAASKVRAVPLWMERIAQDLPTTAAANIYASLSLFLSCQLDRILSAADEEQELSNSDQDLLFADWWRTVNCGSLDPLAWADIDFLTPDQTNPDSTQHSEGTALTDFMYT